jgi:hypothetical protein
MGEHARHLREQAERCRRLARDLTDAAAAEQLRAMADEFERAATAAEGGDSPKPAAD